MKNEALLTINVISYNQEKFIAKCLDSLLSQKTDFKFVIRIFDDCSTDNTLKICENYVQKYPDIIKLYPNETNIGDILNARRSYNDIETKYYMLIESDDYCCNDSKFQKQVDILENNPNYSFCTHNTLVKNIGDKLLNENNKIYCLLPDKVLTYETLKNKYRFCFNPHISSRIVRTSCINFPEFWYRLYLFDATQALLLLEQGDMYNIEEIMTIHQQTGNGVYSGAKARQRVKHYAMHMSKYEEYSEGKLDLCVYKTIAIYVNYILRNLSWYYKPLHKKVLSVLERILRYIFPPFVFDIFNIQTFYYKFKKFATKIAVSIKYK